MIEPQLQGAMVVDERAALLTQQQQLVVLVADDREEGGEQPLRMRRVSAGTRSATSNTALRVLASASGNARSAAGRGARDGRKARCLGARGLVGGLSSHELSGKLVDVFVLLVQLLLCSPLLHLLGVLERRGLRLHKAASG